MCSSHLWPSKGGLYNTSLSPGLNCLWVPCHWHTPALAALCPGSPVEKHGVTPAPCQWDKRQGWRHLEEPSWWLVCRLDGSVAFLARLSLLPTLLDFISWSLLQEHNLSLPKVVQKPQVTTAPICSFLPYLWL